MPSKTGDRPFTHISLGPHPHIAYDNRHTLLTTSLAHCLSHIPAHYPYIISHITLYIIVRTGVLFCEKDTGRAWYAEPCFLVVFLLHHGLSTDGQTAARPPFAGRRGIFLEKNHERLCGFRRNHYICNFNAIQRFVCATPRKDWLADRSSEDEGFFTSIT